VSATLEDGSVVTEELSDVPWLEGKAVRARYGEEKRELLGAEDSWKVADLMEHLGDLKDCSDIWRSFKGRA